MRGTFEGSVNAPRLGLLDTDRVQEVVRAIQTEIADAGNCVIVGRGSAYYLGTRRDAFHVFIYAPFANKVRRLVIDRQERGGSARAGRDGRPRPRGVHQAVFQSRVAGDSSVSPHGQFQHRGHRRRGHDSRCGRQVWGEAEVMHTIWRRCRRRTGAVAVLLTVLLGSAHSSAAQSGAAPRCSPKASFWAAYQQANAPAPTLPLSSEGHIRSCAEIQPRPPRERSGRPRRSGRASSRPERAAAGRMGRAQRLTPTDQLRRGRLQLLFPGREHSHELSDHSAWPTHACTSLSRSSTGPTSSTGNRRQNPSGRRSISNRNDREVVILAAGNAYLTVISDRATVDSTRAQVTTAQALHERAVDQNKAGVIAQIDVLRARVELQTQQQRLIAAENQLAIDKLVLAQSHRPAERAAVRDHGRRPVCTARRHHAGRGARTRGHDAA